MDAYVLESFYSMENLLVLSLNKRSQLWTLTYLNAKIALIRPSSR